MKKIAFLVVVAFSTPLLMADAHFDIAPYWQDGKLLTGGLDHGGNHTAPPVRVYGYEFGEDPFDPFNVPDPGVNQAAGTGSLPAGEPLRFNILSSLLYWDGTGDAEFGAPPTGSYVELIRGASSWMLTAASGSQTDGLIQTIGAGGTVHQHFTTSLYAGAGLGNVPDMGDPTYAAPLDGIYAFRLELTLTTGGSTHASDPFWIVFNNGLSKESHDAAMESLAPVPEPGTLLLLGFGLVGLWRKRRT